MKVKNKTQKILIILFLILISFAVIGTTAYANGKRTVHTANGDVDLSDYEGRNLEFNLSNDDLLNQSNIYCVQFGAPVSSKYKVNEEHTVQDPALAYILAHGPTQNLSGNRAYRNELSQIALWYYVKNTDTADRNIITDNGSITQNDFSWLTNYQQGVQLYNRAVAYRNNLSNDITPTITATYKDATDPNSDLIITVKGNFTKFKLKINDNETTETKDKSEDYTKTMTVAEYINLDKIEITVTPLKTVYSAKYRVLTYSGKQRIIAVTSATSRIEDGTSKTIKKEPKPHISLQKYIIGTNLENNTLNNQNNISNNLNAEQTDLINRKDRNATRITDTNLKINKDTPASPSIQNGINVTKYGNPVKINVKDKVTYQIEVYNNLNVDLTNIDVTDYLQLTGSNNNPKIEIGQGKDIEIVSIFARASTPFNNTTGQWYRNGGNVVNENNEIVIRINSLKANEKVVLRITLQFNTQIQSDKMIRNFAKIDANTNIYRTQDADYIKMNAVCVSLQKYITEVNGFALTNNDLAQINNNQIIYEKRNEMLLDRKNLTASSVTQADPLKEIISDVGQNGGEYGTQILHDSRTPKFYNPVIIEKGDTVTYAIHVYNNSRIEVKDIAIWDFLSIHNLNGNDAEDTGSGSEENMQYINVQMGSGIENQANDNENNIAYIESLVLKRGTNEEPLNATIENKIINFAKFNLNPEEMATIEIKIKLNFEVDGVIRNYVSLERASHNHRRKDADFVVTRHYAVSLEKFVSKVNDEPIIGRDGKRSNNKAKDQTNIENVNPWKPENRVGVEPGDLVTFTIRLKNTGKTKVKITQIYDTFTCFETEDKNIKLVYDESYGIQGNGGGTITNRHFNDDENNANKEIDRWIIAFHNATLLDPDAYADVTIRFRVEVPKEQTDTKQYFNNRAQILSIANKNDINVKDGDGTDNNRDRDFLITKTYAVSLQKFVQAVNGKALATNENRADLQVYSKYVANQKGEKDNNIATWNGTKWRNPVVVNKDDFVTYEIQVTNDGDTYIKSLTILDKILGEELAETGAGIEGFYWGTYDTNKQIETEKQTKFNMTDGLAAGETKSIWITLKVSENNIALDTLTNHAEIENNEMKNKNGVDVIDTTKNNNADEDYIVLDDIVISGIVWNDKANGKQQTYNGVYDEEEGDDHEDVIPGIKVSLYRVGQEGKVAETISDENGRYTFDNKNAYMRSSQTIADYAKYIKAPRVSNNYEYWYVTDELCEGKISKLCGNNSGTASFGRVTNPNQYNSYGTLKDGYYAYYVEFEYDGIKYTTSIPTGTQEGNDPTVIFSASDVEKAGNVQEDLVKRTEFNNKFASIDANGAHGSEGDITIQYNTNNLPDFMPESNYVYNRAMAITSKTNNFQLSKNVEDIEAKLQHVNMGLKGRDIFDLDISTNVYQTEVTVNGVSGVYQFTNEIHLRGGDIRNVDSSTNEDMTNLKHTPVKNGTANVKQPIRKTDINGEETNSNYTKTGLQVKVTYVLTIQNSSATYGTATQVTDYYDDKYDFVKAYSADGTELTANNGRSGTGYKSVVITTPGTELATSEWMDIYVVLNLRDAENLLKNRLNSNTANEDPILMTFNIAEIDIYKTSSQGSITVENTNIIINSEFTRGLIDKDSAPGSINKETVRTTNNEGVNTSTVNGNPTTLEYYYSHGDNLLQFKAEDDTGAAPVLYFMASNDRRTLTGIVFEDKTITNTETRVKTGNGKLDEGENGVYGATVELVEIPATSEIPANIAENFGEVRYQVETGANGNFTIEGFLPGNYLLRYRYGDTVKTALLHQNGNVNKLSYNGEDYQSTNNIGAYNAAKLNEYPNYWYIINETEGVSTGTDNAARRNTVRENVTGFEDSNIIKLNNMKDLIGTYSEEANGTLTANKKYNADRSEIVDIDETKVTNVKGIIEATKMYASTPTVRFELEKPIVENTDNGYHTINSTIFDEYNVNNMNFGIAEVPLTIVKFNKEVQAVTILDSTGNNVLAAISRNADGTWSEPQGAIVTTPVSVDIAIEEDKLQGAHLQATYAVKTGMILEINFDESESVRPTITGMIDFIDNNLSYHPDLSYMGRANSEDWEITTFEELKEVFIRANNGIGTVPKGTVDPEGIEYTTILKAKENNAILLKDGQNEGTAMITLERILSATDSTIEETLLNTIDGLTYNNTVELTGITITTTPGTDPDNPPPPPFTDRIRTQNGFIIRPGSSHDATKAETIIIHPPTGDNSINTAYFILAIISLGIIGIGAFGIKRFVVDPRS